MIKNQQNLVLPPTQSTLKNGSRHRACLKGLKTAGHIHIPCEKIVCRPNICLNNQDTNFKSFEISELLLDLNDMIKLLYLRKSLNELLCSVQAISREI